MIKIFIGGSRNISKLNTDIKDRIDNIMQKEYTIFVGDADGVDKCVQEYLFENNYGNVRIFCMSNGCRNNIGHWEINQIHSNGAGKKKDFHYFAIKDLEMAREADYGFMIWDGKSKGTLNNVLNLLNDNKKALVYFSSSKEFFNLASFGDCEKLLSKCEKKFMDIFEKKLNLSQMLKKERPFQNEFNFLRE
ncbi:MAG: hypothetical protein EHM45_06720 [Desulfobacteraceae bacterium]|nr:MAG: hypothetical protein EHM45_06720 [Desulfobacteraceae bacterium]